MRVQLEIIEDPSDLLADTRLRERIDELGEKSAVAQNLAIPITSIALFTKHATQQQQALLLARVDAVIVGFLKIGIKHLFYITRKGIYKELDPLCVLDFYVHENFQRHGIGNFLFRQLLQWKQVSASQLAYDRPSPKLYAFLQKHAQLQNYFPQPNNFVIFDEYFTS